jgi:hypothetical protein
MLPGLVEAIPIDLRDQPLSWPKEVDHESGNHDVCLRLTDAGLADQGQKPVLELRLHPRRRAAHVGDRTSQLLAPAAPRAAGVQSVEGRAVKEVPALRRLDGQTQLLGLCEFGVVEQGAVD